MRSLIESLSDRYDDFLKRKDQDKRDAGVHASEISKCHRQAVYTMIGEEKRGHTPVMWKRRFDLGHAVHDMLQRQFKDMANESPDIYMSFEAEVRIDSSTSAIAKELDIVSSCDGVFTFHTEGKPIRVGLEIKTISNDGFKILSGPQPDHIEQGHVYMACLGLSHMWFLYYNKNSQVITNSKGAYLVDFDEKLWDRIYKRILSFHEHKRKKTLPIKMDGSHCEFCKYSWVCEPPYLLKREMDNDLIVKLTKGRT